MTSYLNFQIMKNSLKYVSDRYFSDADNEQILEPFTVLVKLAILSIKKEGSKISIVNNKLYIQSPHKWQGAVRYMNGNKREEISLLMKPIIRCTRLFPVKNKETNEVSNELEFIYNKAVEGLKSLKKNYDNSICTVTHSIDYYITIIESHLKGEDLSVDSYEDSKIISNLTLSTTSQVNLENAFTGIWNDGDIKLIHSMLLSNDNGTYVKAIEDLLKSKEEIIEDKIKQIKKLI